MTVVHNSIHVPDQLRSVDRWVLWREEKRDGKPTKVPYCVHEPNRKASSTDADTWTSFDDAMKAAHQADGIGFVLGGGFLGIDLDHCVVHNELHPDADAIVQQCGSYAEWSPNDGVHILMLGEWEGRNRALGPWGGKFEIYDHDRFFTFTGDRVNGTPRDVTNSHHEEVQSICDHVFQWDSDTKVLRKAEKRGGDKFAALMYEGDHSAYDSQSEADLALCNYFAAVTQDREVIDRLFRRSALMRDKWNREDYSGDTITKALRTGDSDLEEDRYLFHLANERGRHRALADLADELSHSGVNDAQLEVIHRKLFVEAQDTDGSLDARREVPGTNGLMYRDAAGIFYGERGSGKSISLVTLGISAAANGEKILYLDRENGPGLVGEWIDAILDDHSDWPDVIESGSFVSKHYPDINRRWSPVTYGHVIREQGFTVVIYDSMREYMQQLGIDANKGDASPLISLLITPLVSQGIAVAITDNVGWVETHRTKGDGGKVDAIPQAFEVSTRFLFDPEKEGQVDLVCKRSRYGNIGKRWTMLVGNGMFDVPAPGSNTKIVVPNRDDLATDEVVRSVLTDSFQSTGSIVKSAQAIKDVTKRSIEIALKELYKDEEIERTGSQAKGYQWKL